MEAEAGIALEEGAPADAIRAAEEMEEAAREARLPAEQARALYLRAQAREAEGDPGAAASVYRDCLDIAVDPPAEEIRWRALAALGRLARSAKDTESARSSVSAARGIVESLASRIADEELRSLYLAAEDRQALRALEEKEASTAPVTSARGGLALSALYRISEIITTAADLDTLLSRVLDLALEIVRAERGLIILMDEDAERQAVRAARGVEPETIADALEYSHSVVKEAAGGRTLVLLDAEDDRSFKRFRSVSLYHIKSLACVPIKVRDRILGTVYLDSRSQGYLFRDEDIEFLTAFANLAGSAIETARLNARLSRENVSLQREVQDLRKVAGERSRYQDLVGKTVRMQAIYDMMDRVSASTLPVLVTGESGTGKELVARALHFGGPRCEKKFFSENVAAIPATLLESELFGHVKGAFTGAERDRKGVFELAHGGTLFLDEIGDMSLNLQSKVLRALQDGEIRQVGSSSTVKVDVRVISATHRDLKEMISQGQFREDLYYRLHGVQIHMPPLRERKEDIPLLVEHFLDRTARKEGTPRKSLDISALQLLIRYDWPGNVRELENEVAKLAALTPGDVITQQDLVSQPDLFEKLTSLKEKDDAFQPLEEIERIQIERALALASGNRAKAAQLLGISRATIYRKIREHHISI
jgi:Nif-specific regulatory protein